MDDYRTLLADAESMLRTAQRSLAEEIGCYPSPISGCDAQFNHLLADRARIAAGLAALRREVFVPTPRRPDETARVESR